MENEFWKFNVLSGCLNIKILAQRKTILEGGASILCHCEKEESTDIHDGINIFDLNNQTGKNDIY
jgi:hypothetical protein